MRGSSDFGGSVRRHPRCKENDRLVYEDNHKAPGVRSVAIRCTHPEGPHTAVSGPVALDDLVGTREALIAASMGRMPDAHRRFLLSFEAGAPDW